MRTFLAVLAAVAILLSSPFLPPPATEWGKVVNNPAPGGPWLLRQLETTPWPGVLRAEWRLYDLETGQEPYYCPRVRFVRNVTGSNITGHLSIASAVISGDCYWANCLIVPLIIIGFLVSWLRLRRSTTKVTSSQGSGSEESPSRYENAGESKVDLSKTLPRGRYVRPRGPDVELN